MAEDLALAADPPAVPALPAAAHGAATEQRLERLAALPGGQRRLDWTARLEWNAALPNCSRRPQCVTHCRRAWGTCCRRWRGLREPRFQVPRGLAAEARVEVSGCCRRNWRGQGALLHSGIHVIGGMQAITPKPGGTQKRKAPAPANRR